MSDAPPASGDAAPVRGALALAVVGLGTVALAAALIQPFASGPVGFDSAASVIHFDRIVAGRHLEAFITATPKPLLTVVYGLLHAVSGDWRAISWATIAAFGLAVALAVWLAARVGGLAAAAFVGIALVASRPLLSDVAIGYAATWAAIGWLVAGLAMSGPHRRPALAGLALALASLARLETLVVVGVAGIALVVGWWWHRGRPGGPARRDWLVLIGFLALPVMLVHDWLLTGDPMFWLSVSARFSAAASDSVLAPADLAGEIIRRYAASPLMLLLAVLGAVALVRDRRRSIAIGLVGLGPAIVVFLLLLAARGTYVSPRYLIPVDLAIAFAAAIGAGATATWLALRLRGRLGSGGSPHGLASSAATGAAVVLVVGVGLAIVATWPQAPILSSFRATLDDQRLAAEHADGVGGLLRCALAALPAPADPPAIDLLVPALERPRLAVDLGLPLDRISGTAVGVVVPGPDFLPIGRLVFHDRLADRPAASFGALEVAAPSAVGDVTLVPLRSDPTLGVWVLRIDRGGASTAGQECDAPAAP